MSDVDPTKTDPADSSEPAKPTRTRKAKPGAGDLVQLHDDTYGLIVGDGLLVPLGPAVRHELDTTKVTS